MQKMLFKETFMIFQVYGVMEESTMEFMKNISAFIEPGIWRGPCLLRPLHYGQEEILSLSFQIQYMTLQHTNSYGGISLM